jgi:3'-phosphoadenosine 5'-phosphosulfate sulfotransferase (PAPS reductase)/FAD synthetase
MRKLLSNRDLKCCSDVILLKLEIPKQEFSSASLASTNDLALKEDMIERLESDTIEETRNAISCAHPFVLFSGGRDSVVTLAIAKRAVEGLDSELVAIHADTTIGLSENLEYVKSICESLQTKLVIVKPDLDFFELARKKGFPRHNARWCCYELKVDPIMRYLRKIDGEKIVLDGIRAEESRQRTKMTRHSWHRRFACDVFHPIFFWNRSDVSKYLESHSLTENPLYSKGFRRATECWCGVFKSVEEFRLLLRSYPEFFEKLVDLESSMRNGGSFLFKKGEKVYLRDLMREEKSRTLTKP